MHRLAIVVAFALWTGVAHAQGQRAGAIDLCGQSIDLHATEVELDCSSGPASALAGLAKLRGMEKLLLRGSAVGDETLALLRSHPTLTRITLGDTNVTNGGLVHLATLKKLTVLDLEYSNGGLTGVGLAHLAKAARLVRLSLPARMLTDVGVANLAKIPSLRVVTSPPTSEYSEHRTCVGAPSCFDLEGGGVTDVGLASLLSLPIERIYLDPEAITDQTIGLLSKMKRLTGLNCMARGSDERLIAGCYDLSSSERLSTEGLESLEQMSVRHLGIDPELLDARGLDVIASLPRLSSLNCLDCFTASVCGDECSDRVEDACVTLPGGGEAFSVLRKLKATRIVYLGRNEEVEITRDGAEALGSLKKLDRVNSRTKGTFDFRGMKLGPGTLEELVKIGNLESLFISNIPPGSDVAELVARSKSLETLVVEDAAMSATQTEELVAARGLRWLDIPPSAISSRAVDLAIANAKLRALGTSRQTCREECFGEDSPCMSACWPSELPQQQETCSRACSFPDDLLLLDLRATGLGIHDLSSLAGASMPVGLRVDAVTDELLAWATALPTLDSLNCVERRCVNLENQQVSGAVFAHLAKMTRLEHLVVPPVLITDTTLAMVSKLASLETLNAGIDEEGVISLRGSKAITLAGLGALRALPRVVEVDLDPELITDASVATLAELTDLESLSCSRQMPDARTGARCIDVENPRVTAKTGAELARFTRARRFFAPPTLIDDDVLRSLLALPSFDSLNCEVECAVCYDARSCVVPSCVNLVGTKVTVPGAGIRAIKNAGVKLVLTSEGDVERLRSLLPRAKVSSSIEELSKAATSR
jgi:hypothetical protein